VSFAAVVERLQRLENPYPGLRPFETTESHLFFGRDQQVGELIGRLERHRFLAVVGVSGSGKSSLVRAGLLPALERGRVLEAGRRWRTVISRPGGAPFENLGAGLETAGLDASSLRRSSHGLTEAARQLTQEESLLVVVDQFEELFRYKDRQPITEDARRRHAAAAADAAEFVQLLLAAGHGYPPVYVILTMRSDYLGDCAEFRDLPETLNDCQYLVPRMTREQRKEAIERPLGRVDIAPSLVQRMLNDAGDEPDQLPILQHALMRTWHRWRMSDPDRTRRIELPDYESVGGFGDALNQHADELLAGVPEEVAEAIFKRLTARGRGNRERRDPARLAELWAVCGATNADQQARVTGVVNHFRSGDATFLSPLGDAIGPDTYIDITHESLIRQWKKLRDEWLPEEQRSAKALLEVAERAGSWKEKRGELLAGLDLAAVTGWSRRRNRTTAWAEHYADAATVQGVDDFIAASRSAEYRRVLWKRAGWSAALLVVLGVAGVMLFNWLRSVEMNAALEIQQAKDETESAQSLAATRGDRDSTIEPGDPSASPGSTSGRILPRGAVTPPISAPTPPAPTPPSPGLQPRVYIQVRSRADAEAVQRALNTPLRQAGFTVPRPEVLEEIGPRSTEVRFFRENEREEAGRIARVLEQAVIGGVELNYVPGHEDSARIRARHFEAWLPRGVLVASLVMQLNNPSDVVRKSAGGQMARDYRANPAAIQLVLDTLSEEHLPSLSADGRINALYFLNASDAAAWNATHRQLAREAIARIRARRVSGTAAAGKLTMQQLDMLEKKLSS